ncbi:LOW QUALITY PROTEIN: putative disease resistance protein At1g50180 [Lycium ferocissimum]|uniref:LOW QUALITY PROTEIN: putative disease resistance protein At1g50180 n=1 Tax=Lycium ferocissimum TaxID=112874 RepID=UPI00281629C8|nr:LOW QUALITY PROTEIN: putative disease resistance protein At1g50180 [Lycium ferocissimum]
MAEAAVSYVAERLIDLFQRKIVFLKNVQQEVEGVRNELIRRKCFLKDADMKQEEDKDARIRNWVSEIRAVAYHAEDVIEIFIHQVESFERQRFFIKCAFYPKKLYWLYKVGKAIESIQTKIREISNNRERYGIRHIQGLGDGEGSSTARERMRELRRSSPLVANKDAVGLEKHVNSVMSILLKEDKRLHVASIVGMGGIGKTTLAKEVYNQAQIRGKFDSRAWVYVSQDYKPTKIIKELILQLANPEEDKVKIVDTMDKLSEAGLEEMLHRRLEKTCYLIVLDDIWTTEAWDIIARSFPDNDKSSRLLLTSRRKEVALHADAHTTPYELKVLSEEESWELFIKKAFAEERECSQDLVDVGKEILKKCDGLPLAITVIGGLLAGKKKQRSEWQRVQRSLSSYLVGSQTYGVSAILALSYHELPPHLKSCFLYLGLLQKVKYIPVKQLMHIWIAHGLIQQKGEQKLEDIAEDFLDELIGRNLVQVILVRADDKVKSCRLHDLLRDFCIMKAKEEIFLEVHQKADDLSISLSESRHHVFYCPPDRYKYLGNSKSYIRSLLSFDSSAKPVNLDCICTSSFKLLKVLYIDSPGLKVISESIGKLCSLKYLGIGWKTRIKMLPRSISHLKNLEKIDMPMSSYYSVLVPNVLWKLENLRHLLGYIKSPSLLNQENLTRMTNLQKVGLLIESEDNLDMDQLCDSLAELESLQSLCLEVEDSMEISSVAGLSKLTHVVKLKLKGELASMPAHPCVFPPNLCQLTLVDTQLHPDSIQVLEKLTNLSTLKLVNAFDLQDYSITISENGFRGLKFLRVDLLMFMQEMKLGKGAMAGLKCLQIFKCYSLRRLPEELISLTNLDKLEIRGMPEEFIARLQLSDLCKLQHIPNIVVGHPGTDDDEWIQEELERASLIRPFRTDAQVIRAAVLFQARHRSPNVNTD